MASRTLDVASLYVDGTTLNAYVFGPYVDNPDGTAPPTATATGTVTSGSVTFTGLADGTRYYAGLGTDPFQYFGFSTPAVTPGSGGSGVGIQDEGVDLTLRTKLNFVGAGVSAADDAANGRTNVTITGAAGAATNYNVKDYGALGDGRTIFDLTTTAASAVVTSPTAAFGAGDVGKRFVIDSVPAAGAAPVTHVALVSSVQSATQITLSAVVPFSSVGVDQPTQTTGGIPTAVIGSNDNAAVAAAVAAAGANLTGGTVFFPAGIYCLTGVLTVPQGVRLLGTSYDYLGTTDLPIRHGSSLHLTSNNATGAAGFVTLNGSGTSMDYLGVDAHHLCDAAVKTNARRNTLFRCQVQRGRIRALHQAGQNCQILYNTIGQANWGDCILMTATGGDQKVIGNQIRSFGGGPAVGSAPAGFSHGIRVLSQQDVMIAHNHIWSGANGATQAEWAGDDINISGTSQGITIFGNSLDGRYGHTVNLQCLSTSDRISAVSVVGNQMFCVAGEVDGQDAGVCADTTIAGKITAVNVNGNTMWSLSGAKFKALVLKVGTGRFDGVTVTGNSGDQIYHMFSGFVPDGGKHGNVFAKAGAETTIVKTNATTKQTFTGDGTTTQFSWTHGLDLLTADRPTTVGVTPGSLAASAPYFVDTPNSTTVRVTYVTAPVNAASIVLNMQAEV